MYPEHDQLPTGVGKAKQVRRDNDAKRTREASESEQSFRDSNENLQFGAC